MWKCTSVFINSPNFYPHLLGHPLISCSFSKKLSLNQSAPDLFIIIDEAPQKRHIIFIILAHLIKSLLWAMKKSMQYHKSKIKPEGLIDFSSLSWNLLTPYPSLPRRLVDFFTSFQRRYNVLTLNMRLFKHQNGVVCRLQVQRRFTIRFR